VNYFDVAPTYGDAEGKLGPALAPYRSRVFLACKTTERRREGAAAELERSLARLRTDYVDLYQLHGLTDMAGDVEPAFARGGAMEVLIEAKRSGRARHLGFSAHSEEAALAALQRYAFDSVLFPVNFTCHHGGFGPRVLAAAHAGKVSVLALKPMARQRWPQGDPARTQHGKCWYQPITDRAEAHLALRFTLGQDVVAALPPGDASLFRLALSLAADCPPLTAREDEQLRELAARLTPIFPA
jgi:aryl-alcohol dehydrogenase-like predicted oxidoreductase